MTRPDGPPPALHSPTDAEYVRKLALAILSTLQNKGLLTPDEVDAILIAARRAAQQSAQHSAQQSVQSVVTSPATPQATPSGPAAPSARPPLKFQVTAQPSAPAPGVEWSVRRPPEVAVQAAEQQIPEPPPELKPQPGADEGKPPMIDIQLD